VQGAPRQDDPPAVQRDAPHEASAATPPAPAFDPTTLPSLESITAESDIRAFLAPGVPAELTHAALRRAWSADPAIRDFVGLAENAWDFTAPNAITGFGPLEMTEAFRRQVADLVGRSIAAPVAGKAPPPSSAAENLPVDDARVDIKAESTETTGTASVPPVQAQGSAAEAPPPSHNPDLVLAPRDPDTAAQHPSRQSDTDSLPGNRPHGRALPK
jgi:Protein of unknown function (DUF3306)